MNAPYASRTVRLGRGLILRPLKRDESGRLGEALAGIDPWLRLGYSEVGLALYLERADPALHRYALDYNSELAGVISVRWPWLAGPFIEIMAVLPQVQRLGLGGLAVGWVAEQAEPLGGNVWATTSDFNASGRAFWHRMGFDEISTLADLIRPGFAELLLRRKPTPR